ncbi:MAG: PaREP1 family protein [Candidatus Methanodesulfokora sp.]
MAEIIIEMLSSDLDPPQLSERCIEGSLDLINQAREELERGDLRQASEKIWESCALVIKAYAAWKHNRRIKSHAELWIYKDEVARELGSEVPGWPQIQCIRTSMRELRQLAISAMRPLRWRNLLNL